jgi:hypothetical protein
MNRSWSTNFSIGLHDFRSEMEVFVRLMRTG